jgi:predicted ATPase
MPETMAPWRTRRLPAEATTFVGRDAELIRLTELLGTARLVTLTGTGGVGKTRLVTHVATRLAGNYADGVCLVELSALREPDLLPDTVAAALGLGGDGGRPALESVLRFLRERSLLLILDTCEHLTAACGQVAQAVTVAAPGVTVLATSRQPLGAPGETTLPLGPLPVPEPGDTGPPGGDAVELFVQRAASVMPGFTLDDSNRADVIRLCRRLSGIPLALELTAVRLRALTLRELAAGITDLNVAAGSRRTALARHQNLRAAIGWSYELCTDAERTLWDRLSVFAGSFCADAAAAVCAGGGSGAGGGLSADEIPAALDGLVRKSVLLTEGARYRLLDPLREFGAARLEESRSAIAVRNRHIAYYLAMAQRFERDSLTARQRALYRELRIEHDNIRGAFEHAFAIPGNDGAAIGIATAMHLYWNMSGMAWEGEYWLNRVLERSPRSSPVRARVLSTRAYLLCVLGETNAARVDALAAIKMAERFGDTRTAGRGYGCLHRALTWDDNIAVASSIAAKATSLLEAADDILGLVQLDLQAVFVHLQARDLAGAAASAQRGLRRLPAGELWANGYLLGLYGIAVFLAGQRDQGEAAMREATGMKHELGDVVGVAYGIGVLGLMAAGRRRYERAAWLLGAVESLWERTGRRYTGSMFLEEWHHRATAAAAAALGEDRYKLLRDRGSGAGLDMAGLDKLVSRAVADGK